MRHKTLKPISMLISWTAALVVCFGSSTSADAQPVSTADSDLGNKLNLPVHKWCDDEKDRKGVIIAVHGMTFYGQAFDHIARELSNDGFVVYAPDMRGFGRWKNESAKFNGDERIHNSLSQQDLLKLVTAARQEYPDSKIFCMGESLGSSLAIWLASNHPESVDGVILSAPCFKQLLHPRPRWAVEIVKGLVSPNKPMTLVPYIKPNLSPDKNLTLRCLADKQLATSASAVELIKTHITNKQARKCISLIPEKFPVLIMAGEKDRIFKSKEIEKVASEFGSKKTSVHIFPGKGHLLLEGQAVEDDVKTLLKSWLQQQVGEARCNKEAPGTRKASGSARFTSSDRHGKNHKEHVEYHES